MLDAGGGSRQGPQLSSNEDLKRKLRRVFWILSGFGLVCVVVVFVLRVREPGLLFHPRTDNQEWHALPHDFEELRLEDQTSAL